jgi:phage-related protein
MLLPKKSFEAQIDRHLPSDFLVGKTTDNLHLKAILDKHAHRIILINICRWAERAPEIDFCGIPAEIDTRSRAGIEIVTQTRAEG